MWTGKTGALPKHSTLSTQVAPIPCLKAEASTFPDCKDKGSFLAEGINAILFLKAGRTL